MIEYLFPAHGAYPMHLKQLLQICPLTSVFLMCPLRHIKILNGLDPAKILCYNNTSNLF